MSGTSADGIDLALVSFDKNNLLKHHASFYQAYQNDIATKIKSLYNPSENEIDRAFGLDVELANIFALAINDFLTQENLSCDDIIAIGSHGQTIRHRPQNSHPFSLQIGCCQTLATLTNIRVVGQFRRKDIALGGQGAPLVPAFHQTIFRELNSDLSTHNGANVFVVNIGGIANLTYLPADQHSHVIGYDTGPGNALLDDWFQFQQPNCDRQYDKNGEWGSTGNVSESLLTQLLSDTYFQLAPPKSTGREYFNLRWLQSQLKKANSCSPQDIQATLVAFTALTIVNAILQHSRDKNITTKIYLCGGGVHNKSLKTLINQTLKKQLATYELLLTNHKDIDSDQLEAIAFAWLAFAYDKKFLSSMSTVTGAHKNCTLGNEYLP